MKTIMKTFLFTLLFMSSMMSCNKEELFVESIVEVVEEDTPDTDDTNTPEEPTAVDTSLPCDFTLNDIQANSTVVINCVLDLEGQTITLPENVTIVYEGGDIINGTINFSGGSTFDGNFLNATLTIGGSTPQLKDPVFNFDTNRWDIVEGVVSDEVATRNRVLLEGYFEQIKDMGINTFKIDKMDAYFAYDTTNSKLRADERPLNVPSDFHLIMTENTHLRLQPNNDPLGCLFAIFKADNVIIEGGNLHGDRDQHDYSNTETSHGWGHTMRISASKNVIVKNMTITDATGDGIVIHAFNHAFASTYRFSENVLITNNKIIRARRNAISITDGKSIIIENNELIDTGISTGLSDGTAPMWAIDVEPVWGGGKKYEIVENVIIRNNIERGSEKGGFICARGDYITYENNTMENTIVLGQTRGSIVRNNTFANPGKSSTVAIYAGDIDDLGYGNERNHSNEVYGNTITGFHKGIFLSDPGIDLHHNTMINCDAGIQILRSRDSKIRDNTIINEVSKSEGIGNKSVTAYINNVDVYNNTIKVKGSPFRFTSVNLAEANKDFSITIRDNDVTSVDNSNSSFSKIRGFDFKNNTCNNSGIRTIDASVGDVSGNTFINGEIRISRGCADISFVNNTITGGKCFYDDNTDATNITKQNNTCD